jgi:Putative MetA-pathway of phenol degradation
MIRFIPAVLFLIAASATVAAQRPLITVDIETVKPGSVSFGFGFDFLQNKSYGLSGLNGDLTRLGVTTLRVGLAKNVEIEVGGVIQNFLNINEQFRPSAIPLQLSSTTSTHDIGDFYLATKFKIRNEGKHSPAFGFRFGVELPNSNQSRGIGVNQTNFFATMIAGKHIGKWNIYGNVGLGILTAPVDQFSQNDVLLYGAAITYQFNTRLTLVGEVNGRANTRSNAPIGTESQGEARFGARIIAAGLTWDVAGVTGVNRFSPRSGVIFGITYAADLFTPPK